MKHSYKYVTVVVVAFTAETWRRLNSILIQIMRNLSGFKQFEWLVELCWLFSNSRRLFVQSFLEDCLILDVFI